MASLRDILSDPQASAHLVRGLVAIRGGGVQPVSVRMGQETYIVKATPLRIDGNRLVKTC